jgi:hypothetical protein
MLPAASFLDQLVDRFRHRWVTNPQYRAAVSGVLGLVVLLALCSCAGIVSSVANRVLATSGFTSNNSVGPLGGGGPALQGASHFPTDTIPTWQAGQVPNGPPIPNSGTPIPTPTHPPTPTEPPSPSPNPTQPGGGGGGVPTTCSGSKKDGGATDTWSFSSCPVPAGQTVTLNISAPGHPNGQVSVLVNFGCSGPGCTNPANTLFTLDGSGFVAIPIPVPAAAANSKTPISGFFNTGTASVSIYAAPVQ